jgi:aldehyde dehydrogenase (NAD+)
VTEASIDAGVGYAFLTGSPKLARRVLPTRLSATFPFHWSLAARVAIVDTTVEPEAAAPRIAWGKLLTAGQSCLAFDYVLVYRHGTEELVAALPAAVRRLYGPKPSLSPDDGRIVNDVQLRRLASLLEDHGGQVGFGGMIEHGCYVAPTVVLEPSLSSPLMTEEIFGPLFLVVGMGDLEEARALIRARPDPRSEGDLYRTI